MTESITKQDLARAEKMLKEVERRKNECKIDFYEPYPKQMDFHAQGATYRERCFSAGNQCGKTYAGAAEVAYHLTGLYPQWWKGRRWDRPTTWWVSGKTAEATRETCQRLLLGSVTDILAYGPGRGLIPKDLMNREQMSIQRGVSDSFDTVPVKHVSGGLSAMGFKSFDRGREKWQGATLDGVWFDEEPDEDIYEEGLARISATDGMTFLTFTPLKGKTKVVLRFERGDPSKGLVRMSAYEAKHMTPELIAKNISMYDAHMLDARIKGIPYMGSGLIFATPEENVTEPPFVLPQNFRYIWGIDFGIDHPFAAVLLGIDMDKDVIHVMHTYRASNEMPIQHCAAMKPACAGRGDKVPIAWPQDGTQRKEFEGALIPTAMIYKKHKMTILPSHATFPDGTNSTWAGILDMKERLGSGRLKVFSSCPQWFEEYREYHMEDGKIVKVRDDLLSATRVGIMAKRFARSVLWAPFTQDGRGATETKMAKDLDFDPFA